MPTRQYYIKKKTLASLQAENQVRKVRMFPSQPERIRATVYTLPVFFGTNSQKTVLDRVGRECFVVVYSRCCDVLESFAVSNYLDVRSRKYCVFKLVTNETCFQLSSVRVKQALKDLSRFQKTVAEGKYVFYFKRVGVLFIMVKRRVVELRWRENNVNKRKFTG